MKNIQAGAVLYAKNFSNLADFYQQVVTLEITARDENFVVLESETFQLTLLQIPDSIATSLKITEPPIPRENTAIKLVFYIESIENARQIVEKLGGELQHKDKEWEFDGCLVIDGHDPEGNVFQLRS